jgi:hypothetical protein
MGLVTGRFDHLGARRPLLTIVISRKPRDFQCNPLASAAKPPRPRGCERPLRVDCGHRRTSEMPLTSGFQDFCNAWRSLIPQDFFVA